MYDGSLPKLQNILFTVKKNSDQKYELLYISSEVRQLLKKGEKFFEQAFFERIFPTLESPLFDFLFEILGKGDKILCPLVLNHNKFQCVKIEGYIISQEDQSYLINVLVSPHPLGSHVKYSWLISKTNNSVYSGKFHSQEIKNIPDWIRFIENRFKFLDKEKLRDFFDNPEKESLVVFPNHLFLSKEVVSKNCLLIQLEHYPKKNFSPKDTTSEISFGSDAEKLIYYDYNRTTDEINWSGAFQRITGYPGDFFETLSKKGWESLIHPEDLHLYHHGFDHSSKLTYKVLHKDGHYVFVQDERRQFDNSNNEEALFLGVIRDVSEIKAIENDLLENRSMLDQLTGVVPGMVFMLKTLPDLSHQYIFVSEGSYLLTGLSPEEILKDERQLLKLVHPEDLQKLRKADLEANKTDNKFQCYFRIITPTGETKWIFGAANRLKQYKNELIWTGFYIDVTYTKEKELESELHLLKYKALFEENPLPIFQFDQKGIILDVNKRLVEKLNLADSKRVTGKNLFDLLGDHPVKNTFLDCIEKGYGYYEGPFVSHHYKDLFHLRINTKRIEDGKSFQAIIEDISEQEYVHNLLSQLTGKTSRVSGIAFLDEVTSFLSNRFKMKHCFIAEIDDKCSTSKIVSYSINGEKAQGFSYDLNKTPCLETLKLNKPFIVQQDLSKKFPKANQIINDKISSYLGVPITDLENNRLGLLVLMDTKPLITGSALSALFSVLADRIGAEMSRTYYENKLIATDQLFRSIAENFPKGTIEVLDKKLYYVYTEGKEYQTSGIDPKKLIGTPHLSKYESYISNEVREYLDKVLKGDSVMFEVIDGDQYYLKSGVPLYNASGEIDQILLVTQNITETKIAEEEREHLIRDLKTQNEELQRFAYIISHNLRAPIVNITSLLELYNLEDPSDFENLEIMENLKMATDILNSTLQDLIEVVSIKKNRIPKIETIDFNLVCHNIERSLYKQIKESNTVLHKDFSEAPKINYIYSHLENFLLNLTTNAIKYKHPDRNPEVKISSYKEGKYTVIKFQDNGIGIDLDRYGDRLFGLYQRFHSHVDGKGLGLYLVREQIRAHNGTLKVNSKVNEGTTFYIFLKNLKSAPEGYLIEKIDR